MKNNENGLTLIEIVIGLIVVGLLTLAFLQFFDIEQKRKQAQLQEYKFFTIADGFAEHFSEKGYYPCPARKGLDVTDVNFGVATDCNADGDVAINDLDEALAEGYNVTARSGETMRIRIGTIPYKEIGIGREDIIDVYDNQMTYAVVEELAIDRDRYIAFNELPIADTLKINSQLSTCRVIQSLNDINGDGVVDADDMEEDRDPDTGICRDWNDEPNFSELVFLSHGENGVGAYNVSGVLNRQDCDASIGSESENCDNDATFSTEEYLTHSSATSGSFDDQLVDNLFSWAYIWDIDSSAEDNLYNRGQGNMAVGLRKNQVAEQKLHVAGNLRVEAQLDTDGVNTFIDVDNGGKVQTTQICDQDGDNCFNAEVMGGDIANPNRLQCSDSGHVVKGIVDGKAECRSIVLDTTDDCPNLQYAVGFELDVNAIPPTLRLDCRSVF